MGHILVIKGADFSENALDNLASGYWLIGNEEIFQSATPLNPSNDTWPSGEAFSALIRGKHVTKVKFKCGAAGTYYVKHTTKIAQSSAVTTILATITCTANDVGNVVEKDVNFTFPNTGFLACGNNVSGVAMYLDDSSIAAAEQTNYNPIYTPTQGTKLASKYYNNDFFISLD